MRAISLWQPWASLWLSPRKIHETRHWPTKHRGPLVVHAAQRFEKDHPPELAAILRAEFGADWYKTLTTGAILGTVNLLNCIPTNDIAPSRYDHWAQCGDDRACGDFTDGRFGWQRGPDFKVFAKPVPFRGLQGIFTVPDELLLAAKAS